jgi:iron complex outermembrane receptor protein
MKMKTVKLACHVSAVGLLAGLGVASTAMAQSTDSSLSSGASTSDSFGDIVVTAQRREESAQKVGISISAFSGDQLKSLGVSTTQGITQQVPALRVSSFSPAFTTFNLRGISQNNFSDNLEAPVAVYIDDVYIGSMNAVNQPLFDVQGVEVLRGPQGTLFGRNATGGLIHYRSKKATNDNFNGYASASYGEFNEVIVEGAVGGGLGGNVRGRIAARYERADGYVKPGEFPPGVPHSGNSAFGANGYVIRGNLQIGGKGQPLLLDTTISYSRDNDVPTGQYVIREALADPVTGLGIDPSPIITGSPWRHASDSTNTGLDREIWFASQKVAYNLADDIQLNYIAAYVDMWKNNREDAGGGLFFFDYGTEARYKQWSHEVRIGDNAGRLRWQLGAYHLDIDFKGLTSNAGPVITGSANGLIVSDVALKSKNWSIYGQAEYDLTDNVTVIGGLRWSQDKKSIAFTNTGFNLDGLPSPTVLFDIKQQIAANPAAAGADRIRYGDWAGRLQVNFIPNDDVLLYASINRGIKGGNWSPNAAVDIASFKHDAETLVAYELGTKLKIFGGKGRLNASVYRYVYSDYQAFSLTNLVPQVFNSDASSYGGETELFVSPNANIDLSLGASYIKSKVDFVPGVNPGSGVSNAEFPQAPRFSLNGLARYKLQVGAGKAYAQVDGVFNTRQFLEGTNSQVSEQKAYFIGNARIGYDADAGWSVTAFVQNVFNKAYLQYNLDLGAAGFVEQVYGRPRQFGGSLSYKF